MKKLLSILIFLISLSFVQTAWAGTTIETRTVTWKMDGGLSGQTTQITTGTLYTTVDGANQSMVYTNSENQGFSLDHFGDFGITETNGNLSTNNGYISFPGIKGTVTKVEMVNFSFARTGLQMYVGKDRSNTSTLLHLQGNDSDFDFAADNSEDSYNKSATFVGSVAVDESTPLKIMFAQTSGGEIGSTTFAFNKGYIKVTYDAEVETTDDPGHDFTSITTSGNTLTATCTQSDPYHQCGLTNRQATLTLSIDDAPYDFVNHTASLNLQEFTSSTSLAVSSVSIVYTNKVTGVERTQGEYEIGSYTATATVTIGGAEYTLNKDFEIYNGTIACDYPQFSFSPKPAIAGNDVTITFTPIAGETVTSLTLTGAKANMSIGNGITDKHDGTYTFTMVSESLTLDATFSEPDASHFEQTGTDEYTIKTANGWNWFCYALNSGLVADGFSGKTVKLATSVGSSEMAGTSGHPFKGTFDGQGNTLTFNLQASEGNSAPFHYTNGATISNLHVTGLIEGNDISSLAGLVGKATGNITISNCHVSTQISTTHSGAAWHGGVIAFWDDSNVKCTITGCVYDGLIYNPNEANVTSYCFGFIGNSYGSNMDITFTDCLFAPAEYTNDKKALREDYGSRTFVYPKSGLIFHVKNCYYTRNLGRRQGRPATTATTAPANLGAARIRIRSLKAALDERKKLGTKAKNVNKPYKRKLFTKEMRDDGYTLLVPQMSPIHFQYFEPVLKDAGYNAVLLPAVTKESEEEGLRYVNNDACYPTIVTLGQIIYALKSGEYDLKKTGVFMSQTGGGCRASNYVALLRKALKDLGMEQIPVISFNMVGLERNPGFTITPRLALSLVYGALYGDLMMKCVYRIRPYEIEKGSAEAVMDSWFSKITKNCMDLNKKTLKKNLELIVKDFDSIPIHEDLVKPKVGIVGEILVKYHPNANNNLVETIEAEGGEAVVPSFIDFFEYGFINKVFNYNNLSGTWKDMAVNKALLTFIESYRKHSREACRKSRRFIPDCHIEETAKNAERFISIGNQCGEGWLLTGEMVDLIDSGVKNILCLQPFACLPNHVAGKGMLKALRQYDEKANIVAIDYDPGASTVNQLNRIKLMMSTAFKNLEDDKA